MIDPERTPSDEREAGWTCELCRVRNGDGTLYCHACGAPDVASYREDDGAELPSTREVGRRLISFRRNVQGVLIAIVTLAWLWVSYRYEVWPFRWPH